jgi:hypothetical protein
MRKWEDWFAYFAMGTVLAAGLLAVCIGFA